MSKTESREVRENMLISSISLSMCVGIALIVLLWWMVSGVLRNASWKFERCCSKWPLSVIGEMQNYPEVFVLCDEENLATAKANVANESGWERPRKLFTPYGVVYYFEKSALAAEYERKIADAILSRGKR